MDPKILKKTQDTLGKIIKKPPLTEKLLGKPPFRFLHDVFTEVIRTSGFLKGLLSQEEMDSKNVTAKEDKIRFLGKIIDCVGLVSGEKLLVRPSKVIAGHEPENTNALLQIMARCIRKKMSSDEAVEIVLNGKTNKQNSNKPPPGSKKSEQILEQKDTEKSKTDSSDHTRNRSSDRKHRSSSGKVKDKDHSLERKQHNDREDASHDSEKDRKKRRERKPHAEDEEEASTVSKSKDEITISSDVAMDHPGSREATEGAEANAPVTVRGPRPASAKGQRRRPAHGSRNAKPEGVEHSPEDDLTPSRKLVRPPSARPAAPRVRQRNEPAGEERIDSGDQHRSAPIIVDRHNDNTPSSDDDEQFLVEEEDTITSSEKQSSPTINGNAGNDVEEHGGLVKKILKTKKELENSAAGQHAIQKRTEIQRMNVANAQQQKEKELVIKEIDQLRTSVQKLCQSAAPLAKIIDYIQEDVDAMQNELQFWRAENKQHTLRLKEEENITQRSIEPLNLELQELDQSILSYRNRLAATKANIIRNDEKIRKMVVAVATQS